MSCCGGFAVADEICPRNSDFVVAAVVVIVVVAIVEYCPLANFGYKNI